MTLNHSLFKNLDLGLSYIYNEETSRNNTENRTDSLKSSNISLGAKYQFLDTRYFSSAISSYVESGYGDISSSTSSSKSKVGASGLVSIYAGTNFLVNLSTGYKHYNNSLFENYQLNGEFSEAISFLSMYRAFEIEAYFKARQLSALNLTTTNSQQFNGFVYGASASADLEHSKY